MAGTPGRSRRLRRAMSGHDEPIGFSSLPLDPLFLLCFYPFRQAHERASSRDVPMMEPPPRKGGPLRGRPRNGGAAPAAGGGRTLRARAAPGHRSPALRPAARSSLMVRATRESGSAARSAARRRTTPLRGAPFGAAHPVKRVRTTRQGSAERRATPSRVERFRNSKARQANPAPRQRTRATTRAPGSAKLFDN